MLSTQRQCRPVHFNGSLHAFKLIENSFNFPSIEVLYNNVMRDTVVCDMLGLHLEH